MLSASGGPHPAAAGPASQYPATETGPGRQGPKPPEPRCAEPEGLGATLKLNPALFVAEKRVGGGPEPVFDGIRRRARIRNQSIQQYMLAGDHRLTQRPDKEELVRRIERFEASHGIELDVEAMLDGIDADRRYNSRIGPR